MGLDEAHYGNAMHYVEQNPVRAKMVRKPWRYPWSSAAVHVGERKDDGLLDLDRWRGSHGDGTRWRNVLAQWIDPDFAEKFRGITHTSRPLGADSFLSRLEAQLGRRLRALAPGQGLLTCGPAYAMLHLRQFYAKRRKLRERQHL